MLHLLLAFRWRTRFESCLYLLQIFFLDLREALDVLPACGCSSGHLGNLKSILSSCWHSTEQSQAPNVPFVPTPHHKHLLLRALCGHLGLTWEGTPFSRQRSGECNFIATFLSPQTASYLHLQSRSCHLALCVRLLGVRYDSDMHRPSHI